MSSMMFRLIKPSSSQVVFSFSKDCRLLSFSRALRGDKNGLPRHGCNGCLKQETDTFLLSFISGHWQSELEGR